MGNKPLFNTPLNIKFLKFGTGEECTLESVDLGSFNEDDYKNIASICNQKLVYDVLFKDKLKGKAYTTVDAKGFITWAQNGWKNSEYFVFIIRNAEERIIGAIDIKSNNTKSAEIGYWADSKAPGVMTNAVIYLCKIAKEAGFSSLFGLIVPKNVRSQGVLMRAGFVNNGDFEKDGKSYIKFTKLL